MDRAQKEGLESRHFGSFSSRTVVSVLNEKKWKGYRRKRAEHPEFSFPFSNFIVEEVDRVSK